jgi:natural product biosynthesis luciferase-like monooxygenase protein
LFFFADDASSATTRGRYDLLLDSARFADDHGFAAVWTPERHFHSFGGLYPNPSVTGAAVAAVTRRVGIRAGSVVMPLHDPLRVAEEWSVVDNISGGRVGISFASGWHANDFALNPEAFTSRKKQTHEGIEAVRRLWRGETLTRTAGNGAQVQVRTLPPPVQPELPVWITSGGTPETYRLAGELGANLLTHLLGQTVEDLAEKISVYRKAIAESRAGDGHVTLMLHTFLGEDLESVRETVREPFSNYLRSSVDLFAGFKGGTGASPPAKPTEREVELLVRRSFNRYFASSGLFGTAEMAERLLDRLAAIGVDEVACLLDFGVDHEAVFDSLHRLARLSVATRAA